MMIWNRIVTGSKWASFIVIFFIVGCNSHKRKLFDVYSEPLITWRDELQDEFTHKNKSGRLTFRLAYDKACKKSDLEAMRRERDKILGKLISVGKLMHEEMDDYLHYGRAGVNILFDIGKLTSTAWATVAPAKETKSLLAAIATGLEGTEQSFNAELFYKHTSAALLSSMHKDRANKLIPLVQGMSQPADKYPLDVGLSEAVTFMLAGGVTDALSELADDASKGKGEAVENLNNAITEARK